MPNAWPIGLLDEFAEDRSKQTQWQAFVRKNALDAPALGPLIAELRMRLEEPLRNAREVRA